MPYSPAASVAGVSLRVTRLDAEGNLLNGPTDSYLTTAFIRVSFTPEYEEGDEITEKAADGTVCVSFKAPDTLKRVNMEIAVCDPDPELSALLSGGLILSKPKDATNVAGGDVAVGWASAQVGEDPSGNGVAVETWSKAIDNGKEVGFFHWVFPFVKTRLTGDRVIENGLLATTFEGFGLGNINFRSGPDGAWMWPAAADRPYLYARSSHAPQGMRGFFTYPNPLPTDKASLPTLPTPTADVFSNVANPGTGTNVPNADAPYAYRQGEIEDRVLSSEDFTPDTQGVLKFEANADSQDVKNVKYEDSAADAIQNPVTYLNRGYAATPTAAAGGTPGTFTFPARVAQQKAPQNLPELRTLGIGAGPAWTPGQYIVLGDGTEAYWNGNTWLAGRAPNTPNTVRAAAADGHHDFGFATTAVAQATPQTITDLRALGALGQTAAWPARAVGTLPEYVTLGDGSHAYWDGNSWESVPSINLDVSDLLPAVAGFADLATLQADGVYGDGHYTGPGSAGFATGQFVTLADGSKAQYAANAWVLVP